MDNLRITSPAFRDNEEIPAKFTCEGLDVNPERAIENVPAGTKSRALVMEDPDAPNGLWVHWAAWNINPNIHVLAEHAEPRESVIGKNSWGHNRYGGPCPPSGTHRYMFRLYALDKTLDLPGSAGKDHLDEAMDGHILAQGVLTGRYAKKGGKS